MRILEGIRVIDWTIWQQGPVASAMLGDLGADVIKVEHRTSGDPGRGIMAIIGAPTEGPGSRNFYFEMNNRNKRSITLDLKTQEAKEIVYRLVEKSDIFVQNFRKGVAEKMGLDYATLSKYNPKLIYATGTGYGRRGPESNDPSFDYLAQARSGIMTNQAEPDLPPLVIRGGVADQMGAWCLAYGILAALVARERLGIGQEIDGSILGAMIQFQGLGIGQYLICEEAGAGKVSRKKPFNVLWNHYQCSDGKWIALGMMQPDRYWATVCRAIGREDLATDPKFCDMASRRENSEEVVRILDGIFATKPRHEWLKIFKVAPGEVICGPVNDTDDLVDDPQVRANEYIIDFNHPFLGTIKMPGIPVGFSKTPGSVRREAPGFGQHTEEVLTEVLGLSQDEIGRLKDDKVI